MNYVKGHSEWTWRNFSLPLITIEKVGGSRVDIFLYLVQTTLLCIYIQRIFALSFRTSLWTLKFKRPKIKVLKL